ncbi:MAG: peptidase [Verrucomicrobiales bacterium]|nr:peptidase [Verrucomicrobiales bacterium]
MIDQDRMAPELLAPAGNWECARAAVANGADAIFFGMPKFNARMRADNFTPEDLPALMCYLHGHGVRGLVTMNTLIFTRELADAVAQLRTLEAAGVDAIIVQDIGLARLARAVAPKLALHASTQMTLTSPEGLAFIDARLNLDRAVLARELSLRELERFRETQVPLEVFVHGALCVAYSGQCLTSESLGQRSANRGECAQACRMPYQLVVDGVLRDLGDKRYLLSPQDLAAVEEVPALLARGVRSYKIEGRLKSPEYVAAVTAVYRKALDAAMAGKTEGPMATAEDRYALEMTFSRGLFSGWMHGVDHQQLVGARYGKKRGAYVGRVRQAGREWVEMESMGAALKAGDGVVFDTGGDTNEEQGGRVFDVLGGRLTFAKGKVDFSKLKAGDRVWKTSDPALDRKLRATFERESEWRAEEKLDLFVRGREGDFLEVSAKGVTVASAMPLVAALKRPLSPESLRDQLGRLGGTGYVLGALEGAVEGEVMLPLSELNRMRRELVERLKTGAADSKLSQETDGPDKVPAVPVNWRESFSHTPDGRVAMDAGAEADAAGDLNSKSPELSVLCRTMEQIDACAAAGVAVAYADFEDVRGYAAAVERVRAESGMRLLLATPRIQKPGEQGFFKLIERAGPDGVLVRNLGAVPWFTKRGLETVGDFSLNVANPLTAQFFRNEGLDLLTVSYDLNISQVLDLLAGAPPSWFELTLHQHMPMFHMEHCVFAAFMSKGKTFLDCGRPCEKHSVKLRDRVGMEHPLKADVGCRNTLFNSQAQTGAQFFPQLMAAGLRRFRIELLEEDADGVRRVLNTYRGLLEGRVEGGDLWRHLKAQSKLGVTLGTLETVS